MSTTLQLDIPLLLPDVADESDACVDRLIADLAGRPGVVQAHVLAAPAGGAAKLCVHYRPDLLPLPRIRELVEAAGAEISARFGHALWAVEGINHPRRARTVVERLRTLPGVIEAGANAGGVVRVEFDRSLVEERRILAALKRLGVTQRAAARGHAHGHGHGHDHARHGLLGHHGELVFSLLAGLFLLLGFAAGQLLAGAGALALAGYLLSCFFGGYFPLREAIDSLRVRRFEIDTLMLVAAAGAAALGLFAEGALLLFLFSLGHALEHLAMGKARRAIEGLAALAPERASLRRGEAIVDVSVSDLAIGDRVLVHAHGRIPADGFLLAGSASIDEASITGESMPADKVAAEDPAAARVRPDGIAVESLLFAGSVNGARAFEMEVLRPAAESTLARMVRLVREAETEKSPTQRLTDRIERRFVPLVLLLAALLLFSWLVIDEPPAASFYRAMAVLVAASPCALAIATPSAVLAGVARAARCGVLVKGGGPLEALGSIDTIAFDKTGTLSLGRPRLAAVRPLPGVAEAELLAIAVAVEQLDQHPLARAIATAGKARLSGQPLPAARALASRPGRGLSAEVAGEPVWIGRAGLFGRDGVPELSAALAALGEELRRQGQTVVLVRHGGRELGALGLDDPLRADAVATVARLRSLGIRRMVLLSGDHQSVADSLAAPLHFDRVQGDLLPEDKVAEVRQLAEEGRVAMVGDGVNDAPAMARASLGIAMGARSSAVALEAADVALMGDDLSRLPQAIALGRRARRVIRQNLLVSLGMVVLLLPLTLFGLRIGPAVALHEGSTLLVVLNALRLLSPSASVNNG